MYILKPVNKCIVSCLKPTILYRKIWNTISEEKPLARMTVWLCEEKTEALEASPTITEARLPPVFSDFCISFLVLWPVQWNLCSLFPEESWKFSNSMKMLCLSSPVASVWRLRKWLWRRQKPRRALRLSLASVRENILHLWNSILFSPGTEKVLEEMAWGREM